MNGDFTRDTFDPGKHYSHVLMQQGRVQLDADWNEQTSILLHYLRTLTVDIFGAHAGPAEHSGFEILNESILAQMEPQVHKKKMAMLSSDPDGTKLIEALKQGHMLIGPGRYYVDGILVENDRTILYREQPGHPSSDDTTRDELARLKSGLLIYLDVWERHITYLEDDHIREVALGGPDTCSRAQVICQVKVLPQPLANDLNSFDWDTVRKQFLLPLGRGKLRARARIDKPPTELCVIPAESRYRGAENQLYRVEVHQAGKATGASEGATFKWSRNNGSDVIPIRTLSGTAVKLQHLGRDRRSTLNSGDWVEIVDELIAVGGGAGVLAQVEKPPDRDNLTVALKFPDGVSAPRDYKESDRDAMRPLLRRWHHKGDVKSGGALAIAGRAIRDYRDPWIALEDGVEIWISKDDGEYRVGDYWLIPARTATGDVEWQKELDSAGRIPAAIEPHGTQHHYAPLALLGDKGGVRTWSDCRCLVEQLMKCPPKI